MGICFYGSPNICSSDELKAHYNKQKEKATRIYINNNSGPDFRFEGIIFCEENVETPEYYIFVTSKLNIVLAKVDDVYESDGGAMNYRGYAVVGKELPEGIVKFFGLGEKAKSFYDEVGIQFYVEI